jgi:hypothetical protein
VGSQKASKFATTLDQTAKEELKALSIALSNKKQQGMRRRRRRNLKHKLKEGSMIQASRYGHSAGVGKDQGGRYRHWIICN